MSKLSGAKTATVQMQNGTPQLLIHGQVVPPLIFFFNTEMTTPPGQKYMESQVKLSAKAGVHLYSFVLHWPWFKEGEEPDFSEGEELFARFLALDPEACFIPRVHNDSAHLYPTLHKEHPEECIRFADGAVSEMNSMASDWWAGEVEKGLRRTFRHYEQSPFADRIIGYIYGSEWFHQGFWDMGWDFSDNNRDKFRQWLRQKYTTDAALRAAWNRPAVTFETVAIPPLPTETTPPTSSPEEPTRIFHNLPEERDYLDFYDYSSEIVADTLITLSRAIKDETEGDKLSIQFYGYAFETMGSSSGHLKMMKTLESPLIDMFVSPVSYDNRIGGGVAAFMTAVDSVAAHGKLWLVENDMRTSVLDMSFLPPASIAEEKKRQTQTSKESVNIIARDFAALHTHRCGTWWMDLTAGAAFNDPAIWDKIGELKKWYGVEGSAVKPYRPDVAVVIDEESLRAMRFLKWRDQRGGLFLNDAFDNTIYYGRHMMYRLGASVGYYYFEDFLNGKLPACKVYFFPCAYYMTDEQIEAVHRRLDREGATAIWQYAPGYLGPSGADAARSSRLTGMELTQRDGRLGSQGWRRLHGLNWGFAMPFRPRLIVLDNENTTETLGRYTEDGAVSAGWKFTGNHKSVFFGDISVTPEVLRPLLRNADVHLWTEGDEVIHTDGEFLAVHAAMAGVKAIQLPAGCSAEALERNELKRQGNTLFVEFEAGESICFKITGSPGFDH